MSKEYEMNTVDIIEDDVRFIRHEVREGWFIGCTVIVGEKAIGLVDSGFASTLTDFVFPAIESWGRSIDEISVVINTHRDGDHVEGNQVIKERTKAVIAIHKDDAPYIDVYDKTITDGEKVSLGDRTFVVVHSPGHTPGSICLFDEPAGLLITGDTFTGEREELIRMDKDIYIASLKRLLELKPATTVMSHPFPPMGKNVLSREEFTRMIRRSIEIAEQL